MKSYTQARNLYGTLTKNTATANLTLGDQLYNDEYRHICAKKDFYFLHRTRTLLTTAATQFANLPYDVDQVESLFVTIGSMRYTPKLITSREQWDLLNQTTYTSDFPRFAFVYNGQIGLWPTPATSSNVITINAKIRVVDLNVADYTTGTIVSIAAGGTAVVGSGTTWTERMGGRWIRFTLSDTVNTGDGEWYEISAVASATTLSLVRAYGGTAIAAGSATYTLGQMPLLPEEFHDTPVYKAAATYWFKEGDIERAKAFMSKYTDDMGVIEKMKTGPITDFVIDNGTDGQVLNPNLTIMM